MANNNEISFTDGHIAAQSTPSTTQTKGLSMDDLFNLMKTMSENINSNHKEQQIDSNIKYNKMNDKFDELKNEIQEINKSCESTKVEFTRCV